MEKKPPLPRYSIALLSATALAYEVLLMRMFSIIQWHHFAYMIISLALLGYGASGTFLTLSFRRLSSRFATVYIINAALFGLSTLGCYLIAQQLTFNPEELLWDRWQFIRLLGIYLLLTLPFFFVANCIGLALAHHSRETGRIYASDLLGAGIGSIGIILLLFLVFPMKALQVLSALGISAAAIAWLELKLQARRKAFAFLLISFIPLILPSGWTVASISVYKGLKQSLQISGTKIIAEHSSPLGLISIMESTEVPLRHAPGLSLNATSEPPPQLALFTDADAMTVITARSDNLEGLGYLDQTSSALPYHLMKPQKVLILGAGGGSEVLQANYHGVEHIDAVELNPQIVGLVSNEYNDFSGNLYRSKNVDVHVAEARGFVSASKESYDLIQLAMLDSFGASAAGLYSLSENYLYTVQAMQEYLDHLSPGGLLAISRWIKLPPRDSLKLFATTVEALRRSGIKDPDKRLVMIRGWQTSTLLIKNGHFAGKEIEGLKRFCKERSFDVVYYQGIKEDEANLYNILAKPYFYLGTKALLGKEAEAYMRDYKFNIKPATDDEPYFFHFFKWGSLKEIASLLGEGGMPLLEWGYLVLIATLIQVLIASLVFILLPLLFLRRKPAGLPPGISHGRVGLYFFALGLAFLFIEIAFIQKFILFLHHPLYATAVVLAGFLFFAGLGSAWSQRYSDSASFRAGLRQAVSGIIIVGLLYLVLLEPLLSAFSGLPVFFKIVVSLLLIAPLAFSMGMPFPLGLARLGRTAPDLIPWVWGVNGCASVLSAVVATILAIHFGFIVVILLSLILYMVAMLSFHEGWGDG
ncbi:MAG: SAM-dependent methyltransferase [Proteobacteria bacterium]|nr:SAM-dependent methyltransferase [Pseudomonadota bacterium]